MAATLGAAAPGPTLVSCPGCAAPLAAWTFPQSVVACPACNAHSVVPGEWPPGGGPFGAPYDPMAAGIGGGSDDLAVDRVQPPHPSANTVQTLGLVALCCLVASPAGCGLPAIGGLCAIPGVIVGQRAARQVKRGQYASTRVLRVGLLLNWVALVLVVLGVTAAVVIATQRFGLFSGPPAGAGAPGAMSVDDAPDVDGGGAAGGGDASGGRNGVGPDRP